MTDGLKDKHRTAIVNLLRSNERVDRAVLFGSRATEMFTLGSDVDIALFGEELTTTDQARLVTAMEKLNVPQRIDLLLYDQVEDEALREHVQRDGVELYRRPNNAAARFHALENWRRSNIFSLAHWKNGLAFKNIDFTETGRPIIKIAELKAGVTSQTARTMADYDPSVSVGRGDMLFSWSGNPDTSIDVFRWEGEEGWLNQHIFKVTPCDGISGDFLFFLLKWLKPKFAEIARNRQTTGLGHVTIQDLKQTFIDVPDARGQAKIVGVIGPIQDKIELNRRMNETLEAMARAIFKDWFVDFGPTRARMEGREPYLPPELWDLFPDALDGQGKPAGWTFSEIGEEAEVVGGGTPSTKELSYWDGGMHHWATPKDLSKLTTPVLLRTERKITDAGVNKISSGLLPVGAILMSSRAPIGYLAITEIPTAVNQGFIAMVCRQRLPNTFVLFWCQANLDYIKDIAGGSTFAEISKRTFRPVPVLVPSVQILAAYDRLVRPLYVRIVANAKESDTLARTRDILLPKLMSGEISLRDVEKATEAVA